MSKPCKVLHAKLPDPRLAHTVYAFWSDLTHARCSFGGPPRGVPTNRTAGLHTTVAAVAAEAVAVAVARRSTCAASTSAPARAMRVRRARMRILEDVPEAWVEATYLPLPTAQAEARAAAEATYLPAAQVATRGWAEARTWVEARTWAEARTLAD